MTAITICTPNWHIAESYGRIANELRNGLTRRGYHVNTVGKDAPEVKFEMTYGGIFLAYPNHAINYGAISRMGEKLFVTMFESDQLPDGWVEALNQSKAAIVPSQWCKDVFKDSGVTVPVHVVPLGVSEAYQYTERPIEVPDDYVHNFLAIGLFNARKGYTTLCKAFYLAFNDDPNYQLTFKNRGGDIPEIKNFDAPTITWLREDFTDAEMNEFYGKFDYMVFPSHGEGFGLPPREFAATGGISLVSNYSGLKDDLDVWGQAIPVTETEPGWSASVSPELNGVGEWAHIDEDVLAERLKYIVENRAKLLKQSSLVSRNTRALYSWDDFTTKVLEIWEG